MAGRPRDREDARAILLRQSARLDLDLVARWLVVFSELLESDGPRLALEELRAGQ